MQSQLSARWYFLTLLCITGIFLFINAINFQHEISSLDKIKGSYVFESIILRHFESWAQNNTNIATVEDIEASETTPASRPWYFKNGERLPEPAKIGPNGRRIAKLWPEEDLWSDRIENHLMFYPPKPIEPGKLKKILLFYGLNEGVKKPGRETFAKCPVNSCTITINQEDAKDADAIFFYLKIDHPDIPRPSKQVWILFTMESPYHTNEFKYIDIVNWTSSYRSDSDIVNPYGKWIYYDPNVTEYPGPLRDFKANKTDKVAWFVTNCGAKNNRLEYAQELQKYIQVDIYGGCGKFRCSRSREEECFELLEKKYKFYLAFENSNCKEYISEKFFNTGLRHNILPIVMGAPPEDYAKAAPKHSYIHVEDFESPKQLAEYLHKLDQDDDLYNAYFKWKGTGEVINTRLFCRLCALLHDDFPIRSHRDVSEWWRAPGTCTRGSWREMNQLA